MWMEVLSYPSHEGQMPDPPSLASAPSPSPDKVGQIWCAEQWQEATDTYVHFEAKRLGQLAKGHPNSKYLLAVMSGCGVRGGGELGRRCDEVMRCHQGDDK